MLGSGGFALVWIVGMFVMPLSGSISDRFSRVAVSLSAILGCGIGLVYIVVATGVIPVLVGVGVFAGGLMPFPSAMQAYLLDIFPDSGIGGDFGVFKTIYTGFGGLGPVYVGSAAGYTNYTLVYLSLLSCLVVTALILSGIVR